MKGTKPSRAMRLMLSCVGVLVLASTAAAQDAGRKPAMGPETALVVIDIQQ